MLTTTDNGCRLNATDSVDSVRTNVYSVSTAAARRLDAGVLGGTGEKSASMPPTPPNMRGCWGDCYVVLNDSGGRTTGIVKIPLSKFYTLAATHTIAKRTHHFSVSLKTCCKTGKSLDSIYSFNPFVVGSTPARPTNI
jgi:hypothetical protein